MASQPGKAPRPTPAQSARTIELPPLFFRADVVPATVKEEDRTVDLTFTTGAAVERFDWDTGKRYLEKLSMDPANVRIDRLNQGGPLLDSHSTWSVADILGAVVPGSVTFTKTEARCTVRFSRRDAVQPIWQDVRDGIVRSVSVGYRIYAFQETQGKGNALPVRLAVDWEPFEVSMVPIPADFGAMARGAKPADTNACQVLRQENKVMDNDTRSEFIVEDAPAPDAPAAAIVTEPSERDLGADEERERCETILNACTINRLPASFAQRLMKEKVSLVRAQTMILAELGKRNQDDSGPGRGPQERGVTVGDDPLVHVRAGMENAILHRVMPAGIDGKGGFVLSEQGRQYRGMSLLRTAEAYLHARGIRTTGMSKMEMAGAALGLTQRGGFHTTSDFANLLADVAHKTLRAAYEEAPQTFTTIGRRVTLPDFKPSNRVQIGDAPALLPVLEHAEFTRGSIVDSKEVFQLATFGRIFAVTRQALINDDTSAFGRVATMFGRSARNLESDLVWQQITTNPIMGDGNALFSVAHKNLDAVASVISVASLSKARAAMRIQTSLDGVTLLNVNPKYILLPASLETTAAQFLTQITPALPGSVNPFAGILQPVVEPRLDVNSVTAWYLAADGSQIDLIEYAYLEGENGPTVDTRIGFDIDGLEIKARHDFAAKVIDWRGLWKNPGV